MTMNLKSINELPETDAVTENDYIVAVQDGQGKRLPAGNFTGGGGGAEPDAIITTSDFVTLTFSKGSYDDIFAKLNDGLFPIIFFIVAPVMACQIVNTMTDVDTGLIVCTLVAEGTTSNLSIASNNEIAIIEN